MPFKQKGFKGSRGQGVKGNEPNSNQTTTGFAFRYTPATAGWDAKEPNV